MKSLQSRLLVCALSVLVVSPALGGETPRPSTAYLYIGWPNDGEVVRSPFRVWFGLRRMGIAPSGVVKENTGHHHLIIDGDIPPLDEEIPSDRNHLHFGAGQSETLVELPPGQHTLQLLFADHDHVPHDPPVISDRISVTVSAGAAPPADLTER